jgi:phenylpyruvate tautomerase PptA (4-oxalocrotonate tautomerase family)
MPMLDAYIPENALSDQAEANLMARLTDILIRHEGVDPENTQARSLAWVFVHRPKQVWVAGAPSAAPYYKFVTSVPEGQFNRERREAMIKAVTDAVLDAEQGAHSRDAGRVWVITPEIPDGTWGHDGQIYDLARIAGFVLQDQARGDAYAKATLASRRYQANLQQSSS